MIDTEQILETQEQPPYVVFRNLDLFLEEGGYQQEQAITLPLAGGR